MYFLSGGGIDLATAATMLDNKPREVKQDLPIGGNSNVMKFPPSAALSAMNAMKNMNTPGIPMYDIHPSAQSKLFFNYYILHSR